MKSPKKPIQPQKVSRPTEKVNFTKSQQLYGKYTLADIIKLLPKNYPLDKARIEVTEEDEEDDYYDSSVTYLHYEIEEPNPHFRGQMKAYHRKIKTYKKKMDKYEGDMKIYLKQKKEFDTWFKIHDKQKRIEEAKSRLAKAEQDLERLRSKQ